MRGSICGLVISCVAWLCACASVHPVTLEVDATSSSPATVEFQMLSGIPEQAIREPCTTPCTVDVPTETWYEVRLKAPGYYPARMRFSYEMLETTSTGPRDARRSRLLVPLFPLPPGATSGGADAGPERDP